MSLEEQIINHEWFTSYRLDQIKRFFFHVHFKKYAAKVLITRRAYVLFKMFTDIMTLPEDSNKISYFDLDEFQTKSCPKDHSILNSHSLNYINKIIDDTPEEKKADLNILLVDDVIINGRTISKDYDRISKILENNHIPSKNIDVWCLDLNKSVYDLPCIKIPKNQIKVYWDADERIWKDESTRLTNSIMLWNKGYTSIVNVYKYKMSLERIKNYFKSQKDKYVLIKSDSNGKGFMPEKRDIYCVFLKEDIDKCRPFLTTIRFLEINEDSTETLAIPFVIPKSICIKELNYLYDITKEKYSNIPDIPECFKEVDNAIDAALLFYKWIIFKASSSFNEIIINEMNCDYSIVFDCYESYQGVEGNDDTLLKKEYFDNIYNPEEKLTFEIENCIDFFNQSLTTIESKIIVDSDTKEERNTILYYEALIDYLQTIKKLDEERAKDGKPRYIGLQINRMVKLPGICFKNNNDTENKIESQNNNQTYENEIYRDLELLSALFRSWDDGTSSGVIEAIKNDSDEYEVGIFTKHGEQIFAAIYKCFKKAFLALSLYNHYDMSFKDADIKQFAKIINDSDSSYDFDKFFDSLDKYGVNFKKLKTEISALSVLFYDCYDNNQDKGLLKKIESRFDSLFLNHKKVW